MSKLEYATVEIQNQFLRRDPRVQNKFTGDTDEIPFRCNISDWAYLVADELGGDVQHPTPLICPICSSIYPILAVVHSLLVKCNLHFNAMSPDTQQLIKKVTESEEISCIFENLVRRFDAFSHHLFRKGKYPAPPSSSLPKCLLTGF